MAAIRRTRTITAAPQEVWDVLADFGSISTWAAIADHSCLLTPSAEGIAVGTTRRVQAGRNTLVERIVEFDPPNALAYDIEGFPRWLGVRSGWTLRPAASGQTVVTLTSTVQIGPRHIQHRGERIVTRLSAGQLDTLLADLANRMEKSRA